MTAAPSAGASPPGDVSDVRRRPRGHLSYVSGLTDDPLRFVTVCQALDEVVSSQGSRPAAIFSADRNVLSWKDIQRQSDEVAAGLLALGIRRGNRVGIWSPNRREWLLAHFGTARIGAVLVILDCTYRTPELEQALNKARCRALIVARAGLGGGHLASLRVLAPELDQPGDTPVLACRRLPHLRHVIVLGEGLVPARAERFSDFIRRGTPGGKRRLAALAASLDPDDAASIRFTRGTTGAPKAVTLSHFSIVNNARFTARTMRLSEVDKLCIAVPLDQDLGLVLGVMACVVTGATMVLPGEQFDASRTLDAVSRHRCTALHGNAALFAKLLAHPDLQEYDTSSLRTGVLAGGGCSPETLQGVVEELGMDEVTLAYGLTEVGPVTFQSDVDDPLELRAETVGRVHPNIEVKIVDREDHIVPVGRKGELCVRGYSVMRGYWDEPKHLSDAFDEAGWLRTGDVATLDAAGYCRILGRIEEMVVLRGGELVSPLEVEAVLRRHPKVLDARVFGVPAGPRGDELCAWVVLRRDASVAVEDIRAYCRGKLALVEVPGSMQIVEAFPVTATNKAQRAAMRSSMLHDQRAGEARTA